MGENGEENAPITNEENSLKVKQDETCGYTAICCPSKRFKCFSLQSLATAKSALLLLCFAHLIQQTVMSGLLSVAISTLEKRFELQSTETGIIASSFDVASVFTLVIISLLGEDVHKPTWIGWGVFISGIGSLIFTLPHFFAPTYSYIESETFNYCGNVTESICIHSNLRDFRYVFIAGVGIFGIGANPLYTHAITYLDESVKKNQSSLYNGIYYAMGGLGPAVGYLLGGAALELYTDVNKRDQITIDSSSHLWIGAWWLGFLACGFLLMGIAIPLLLLPRYIPGTGKHRLNRNLEVQKNMLKETKEEETSGKKSALSESWSDIVLLLKNKPFIFMTLGCTVNCAFIFGFNTFGAKYLESTFGVTAFYSSLIYGTSAIFASMGGQIVGSIVVSRFSLSVRGILKFMIFSGVFSTLCSLGFFVHCSDTKFAGGTVPYMNETLNFSPEAACNIECRCSTDRYEPVCGEDGITYFSPCFAGCRKHLNQTAYTDCSCIQPLSNTSDSMTVLGSCETSHCAALIPFIFIVFICFFSSILTFPTSIQVTLRCVPFKSRTIAMALQRLVILALGVLPGRILTGLVLDLACVTWSTECGEKGSCRAYKRWDLSKNATLLLLIQTAICVVFYVLVYITYKPTSKENTDEETMVTTEKDALVGIYKKESTSNGDTDISSVTKMGDTETKV